MRGRCWVVCLNGQPQGVCQGAKKDARRLMQRLYIEYFEEYHFTFESFDAYRTQCHWDIRQVGYWGKS